MGRLAPPVTSVGGGSKVTPGLLFLKYCKNVISVQNMLIYFTLRCMHAYIFNRGVEASKANLLKMTLI